ncbi:MAG TPA: methionyl-tRNA formyltransferase [Acidobacteriota bacterium]|jgi:methionyl-tRNA formyltransferase
MKIVFFGSPEAALPSLTGLLEAGHRLDLIITQPDRPAGRGQILTACPVKRFALEKNLPVLQPEKIRRAPEVMDRLAVLQPDIQVVVAYGQIIPGPIIYLPPHRTLNVHFSLLPKYRGASPVAWSILQGETRTGVTIIELNEKMDEGDILAQTEIDIRPEENARELEGRLAVMGAGLLLSTLDRLADVVRRPQDHCLASHAPKLKKEDGRLDWTLAAQDISRRVRAYTPWPSAFGRLQGRQLKILEGRLATSPRPPRPPGTISDIEREGIVVQCGQGNYLITRLQAENRNPMAGYEFSLGARLRPGDRFEL